MQPDETNIVDGQSLDEDWAKRNFLGKSVADAYQIFCSDQNHCFTEDFMYLSDLAVRFYLPAAILFVESKDSGDDYLFVGGLASSLAHRINEGSLSPPTIALARKFASLVLKDLLKFGLDPTCPDDHWWINQLESVAASANRLDSK